MSDSVPTGQWVCDETGQQGATLPAANYRWFGPEGLRTVGRVPRSWERLLREVEPGRQPYPVVFMLERRSPCGNRRLVVVEREKLPEEGAILGRGGTKTDSVVWATAEGLKVTVVIPGGLFRTPRVAPSGEVIMPGCQIIFSARPPYGVRYIAGQPDPSNASRFTIEYFEQGRPGIIDGRLRDDDGVNLVLRKP